MKRIKIKTEGKALILITTESPHGLQEGDYDSISPILLTTLTQVRDQYWFYIKNFVLHQFSQKFEIRLRYTEPRSFSFTQRVLLT